MDLLIARTKILIKGREKEILVSQLDEDLIRLFSWKVTFSSGRGNLKANLKEGKIISLRQLIVLRSQETFVLEEEQELKVSIIKASLGDPKDLLERIKLLSPIKMKDGDFLNCQRGNLLMNRGREIRPRAQVKYSSELGADSEPLDGRIDDLEGMLG